MANNSLDCWPENVCSLSDGSPSHLKNPLREFFKLFLRFILYGVFRSLRRATKGAALWKPAIFREKLSKAFELRGVFTTQVLAFQRGALSTQE